MELNEYQEAAKRTANHNQEFALANWGLGLTGEAGEVGDLIKKCVFHNHNVDQEDIKKELGDVLWYLAQIATSANITLEEVAVANIEKLKKRYPNGFSTEDSIKRADVEVVEITEPLYFHRIGAPVLIRWEEKWQDGQIVNGYRTHDGIVHVKLADGRTISFGEARHEEYLKEK